jgi:uncharacterized membrane protein
MRYVYLLSVWLHILAAIVWIGGMVFLGVVLVPVLRQDEFKHIRTPMLYETALRFRWAGWVMLGLLVVTGFLNVGLRGYPCSALLSAGFWQSTWGTLLAWKLVLVTIVLGMSAVHDFMLGPRTVKVLESNPDAPEAERLRRWSSWMGRLTLLLSLVILAFAVALVRGGF